MTVRIFFSGGSPYANARKIFISVSAESTRYPDSSGVLPLLTSRPYIAFIASSSLPAGYLGFISAVVIRALSVTASLRASMLSLRFSSTAITERFTHNACISIFAPFIISSAKSDISRETCDEYGSLSRQFIIILLAFPLARSSLRYTGMPLYAPVIPAFLSLSDISSKLSEATGASIASKVASKPFFRFDKMLTVFSAVSKDTVPHSGERIRKPSSFSASTEPSETVAPSDAIGRHPCSSRRVTEAGSEASSTGRTIFFLLDSSASPPTKVRDKSINPFDITV